MKKLALLLFLLFPLISFAQKTGAGDGGPRLFADSRTANDGLFVSPFGENVRVTTGGDGGPHRVFAEPGFVEITTPVSNNRFVSFNSVSNPSLNNDVKPSDLVAAFELYSNGNGTGGGKLVNDPQVTLRANLQEVRVGNVMANFAVGGQEVVRERAPEYRNRENRALRIVGLSSNDQEDSLNLFEAKPIKLDTDAAFNTFGGEALGYRNIGKVLDVETADQGVMDRETLIDTKPEWLRERGGNFWVKKDAPIVNYQNDKGEVFEFKVEAPKKEENGIIFEIPSSDD